MPVRARWVSRGVRLDVVRNQKFARSKNLRADCRPSSAVRAEGRRLFMTATEHRHTFGNVPAQQTEVQAQAFKLSLRRELL
jgi:hypothetical protein